MKHTPQDILSLKMEKNDANATSVHAYLKALLCQLWHEGEGFSGKRPFGNSGWEYDLYTPLVKAGIVKGKLDADGFIESIDDKTANHYIFTAIDAL